eukprot:1376901-Rhodomonas_salina.2
MGSTATPTKTNAEESQPASKRRSAQPEWRRRRLGTWRRSAMMSSMPCRTASLSCSCASRPACTPSLARAAQTLTLSSLSFPLALSCAHASLSPSAPASLSPCARSSVFTPSSSLSLFCSSPSAASLFSLSWHPHAPSQYCTAYSTRVDTATLYAIAVPYLAYQAHSQAPYAIAVPHPRVPSA